MALRVKKLENQKRQWRLEWLSQRMRGLADQVRNNGLGGGSFFVRFSVFQSYLIKCQKIKYK